MSNTQKLKVGQVGVAGFGGYRLARLRESGLFDLVAVHDWNAESMNAAAAEEGAAACATYEALLETPGLEAVIISTGGKFHAEQGVAAMERGLHVFIEKPLCATPDEVVALLEAQKKFGVVGATGHSDHSSYAPSVYIKHAIDSGELGTIATFEETTAHSGGLVLKPGDWRGDPLKNPGGMLFQCGVHAFHELMYYFGPISEISCLMRYDVHTSLTADVAICQVKFASGLIGTLNAYHVTPYRHTLSIYGTRSNLYRDDDAYSAAGPCLMKQTTLLDGKAEPRVSVPIEGASDNCGNLRSFYKAIRQGGEPYPSLRDGARAVAVVFAAEEASRQGRMVPVPEVA